MSSHKTPSFHSRIYANDGGEWLRSLERYFSLLLHQEVTEKREVASAIDCFLTRVTASQFMRKNDFTETPPICRRTFVMETEPQREPLAEIPLSGGQQTPGIVRVGNTVRRFPKDNAPFVHDLLLFLEDQGFPFAPRFLGLDRKSTRLNSSH